MKKPLILVAHPDAGSFNHQIFHTVNRFFEEKELGSQSLDLYRADFSPVLSQAELYRKYSLEEGTQALIRQFEDTGDLVVIYPEWWGMVPAVLKGWLDQVLRPGVAYEHDESGLKVGLCSEKKLLVLSTAGEVHSAKQQPLRMIWEQDIGAFCGFSTVQYHRFVLTTGLGQAEKTRILKQVESILSAMYGFHSAP